MLRGGFPAAWGRCRRRSVARAGVALPLCNQVNEVDTAITDALNGSLACRAADLDGNRRITVDEILRLVNLALVGF